MGSQKAYRDTRTGGIRLSTKAMGYPYVEATAAEAKAAKPSTEATTTTTRKAGAAKPADDANG